MEQRCQMGCKLLVAAACTMPTLQLRTEHEYESDKSCMRGRRAPASEIGFDRARPATEKEARAYLPTLCKVVLTDAL
eukprot:2266999-Pleurochrysis_carterae.AAC.2